MNDPFAKWRKPTTWPLLNSEHVMVWRKTGTKSGFWQYATWPTSRRRRLPIGLHRDPLRNWVVSDMTLARCKPLSGPFERTTEEWTEEWNAGTRKLLATLRANEDAAYRLRRDYARVKGGSK